MSNPAASAQTMSGTAQSSHATPNAELDAAVSKVKDKAQEFARLPVGEKRHLVEQCIPALVDCAAGWVEAGCRAKGLDFATTQSTEEWLAGPSVTVRNLRLLASSLHDVERLGKPPLGAAHHTRNGRVEVDVFPTSGHDKALFGGFTARVRLLDGWDEQRARESQASFYGKKDPSGGLSLILGAGNVSSIPPMDVLYKMFVDGNVCVLKMNPVNEWVGPFLERAMKPLVDKGYLAVVYGGGDVGKYLVEHPAVDDIHITGSDKTHDLIVWGPPGPERERRKKENDPVLQKTITSELGNVSPVVIVPADYSDDELWFQARSVATMVTNNASFNCNAGKMLILSEKWSQRDAFLGLVEKALAEAPTRNAYYPGAFDRYKQLTDGREVKKIGQAKEGQLPWTVIRGVDSSKKDEMLFSTEPFCAILSTTTLPAGDPAEFLAAATTFCNDTMWGTLNASITIAPRLEKDPVVGKALDKAVDELRYGSVVINHWPGLVYGLVSPPWGGHPSATLQNIQSGTGWVHNTYMLEGIEKTILRGPIKVSPKPAWFYDNRAGNRLGPKLVKFEAAPSWLKVPGMAITALGG